MTEVGFVVFFFSLLRVCVCVYRSSQKADDGECDFFH